MIRQFDESTLSAFLDGELDPAAMREVDEFLQRDAGAREYAVNAARTTAFLKAASNAILHAKVPEHLVAAVESRAMDKWRRKPAVRSLIRIAAAVILVFAGFGAGRLMVNNEPGHLPLSAASVLEQYSHVVDAALENNLSGNSREWSEPRQPVMIMVTPIRTYRDSQNIYYREYRLEVNAGNRHQQVNGLAYRTGGGKWITKALFF
jgi:predicted anti-sigma-YlaC factor YlaD